MDAISNMKRYTALELAKILDGHAKWLKGKDGGIKADLSDADLIGADLSGADLRGCNLRGAKLIGVKNHLYVGQRSDGYQFFADHNGTDWHIRAECRYKTIAEYRKHIETYSCTKKRSETKLLLDYAELIIADRGIVEKTL